MNSHSAEAPRQAHDVDVFVGQKLRIRRKFLGMTQAELGDHLELTFQQVQKYERGANRLSASKLYAAAKALQVPVSYFFDGFDRAEPDPETAKLEEDVHQMLATPEGMEMSLCFSTIRSPAWRRKLLDLITSLAESEKTN